MDAEKAQRTPAQRKLDSQLIFALKKRSSDPLMTRMTRLRVDVAVRDDGATLVDLTGSIQPALQQAIRDLGGSVVSSDSQWDALRAWVPVSALESLASRADVRWIERASSSVTDAQVISEGDAAHGAPMARATFQVDGSGVKICAISDGVQMLASLQQMGELPAVDVLAPLSDQLTDGNEGTAILEIIHDLAPGAALGFAPGIGSPTSFASQIMALRFQAGCDVIVDDISVGQAPAFGGGPIAQAVSRVTDSGGVYVTSAGNSGGLERGIFPVPPLGFATVRPLGSSSVWEGDFRPVSVGTAQGARLRNDFGGGVAQNKVLLDSSQAFVLQWSDPPLQAASDYDLILIDSSQMMTVSNSSQTGTQPPSEVIDSRFVDHTNAVLIIERKSGSDRFLRLHAFDDGVLQVGTTGALFGHKGLPAVIAVGAADAAMLTTRVEPFSSDGPRRIFFRPDGSPITPGNFSSSGGLVIAKPDVVGADAVITRTTDDPTTAPIGRFGGTSAAAPHVAAIAGLVLAAAPRSLDRKQVARRMGEILRATATPLAEGGPFDTGAGAANAPPAVNAAAAGLICGDGRDNDGDGRIDAADPGCASVASFTEAPACNDGVDNDQDGLVDLRDADCSAASDETECGTGGVQSLAVVPLLAYLGRRKRARSA